MPSILAVIVSYNPESALAVNVAELLKQVDDIVIVDNASSPLSRSLISSFSEERIHCIFNERNNGVAEGFNQGLRWGLKKQYEFFLLMDQDSRVKAGMVGGLKKVATQLMTQGELAIVGPRHEDFDRELSQNFSESIESSPLLITSGSLLSRQLIEKFGMYDERLFIDHVDHDYSLRIAKNGGRCLKVNDSVLMHKFGEAKVKTVLGKSFFMQEYSAFRRYHMMRNRVVLYKRYGMFSGNWFWLDLRSATKDLIKLVLFETEKTAKLKAVLRGLLDGIAWKDENKS